MDTTGYHQVPNGLWVRDDDSSGPFLFGSDGFVMPFCCVPVSPPSSAGLVFSVVGNSMYLALVSVGGM
jgi:hypothetical protein